MSNTGKLSAISSAVSNRPICGRSANSGMNAESTRSVRIARGSLPIRAVPNHSSYADTRSNDRLSR
jgi:hypothetical protein